MLRRLLILLAAFVYTPSTHGQSMGEKEIVEALIQNYGMILRPNIAGQNETGPTIVSINTYVRSIDFISTNDMNYQVQLTFRMQWVDPRLRFSHMKSQSPLPYVSLPAEMLGRIWKPDLFFSNEKELKIHTLPSPNEYLRIFPNGEVLHSIRLTVKLSCPIILMFYPFGHETCSMRLASYGFTTQDIIFKWKPQDPIQVTSALHLSGYSLMGFTTDYCDAMTNTGTYTCLRVDFLFKREYTRALRQVYYPMITSLFLIWLSMWINPDEKGVIRLISLLAAICYNKWATSQLTPQVPPVSYTTAFDRWVVGCNVFILVAIVEFLVVMVINNEEAEVQNQGDGDGKMAKLVKRLWKKQSRNKMEMVVRIIYPISVLAFIIYYFSFLTGLRGLENDWPEAFTEDQEGRQRVMIRQ